jgi:Protein of unknown function (DUF1153)
MAKGFQEGAFSDLRRSDFRRQISTRVPAMARKPRQIRLPSADVKRWGSRRKAAVVTAVQQGLIAAEEAYRRYELSEEEFSSWQRAFERYGVDGLHVTSLQRYRDNRHSQLAAASMMVATAHNGTSKPVEEELQESVVANLPVSERV